MSPADLTREILAFVSAELVGRRAEPELEADDDLLGGGLVDSLGVMRLVRFIEQRYDVAVPHGDVTIENFMTAHTIATYLSSRGIGNGTPRAQ